MMDVILAVFVVAFCFSAFVLAPGFVLVSFVRWISGGGDYPHLFRKIAGILMSATVGVLAAVLWAYFIPPEDVWARRALVLLALDVGIFTFYVWDKDKRGWTFYLMLILTIAWLSMVTG